MMTRGYLEGKSIIGHGNKGRAQSNRCFFFYFSGGRLDGNMSDKCGGEKNITQLARQGESKESAPRDTS